VRLDSQEPVVLHLHHERLAAIETRRIDANCFAWEEPAHG
jgi:hypothetical protein